MQTRYFVGEDALLKDILDKIQFRIIGPDKPGSAWDTTDLSVNTAYKGLDMANTQIWDKETPVFRTDFLETPRLSTIAIAYLFNRLVRNMPNDQVYLNVGVWCGWSLFAGIIGNDNKICIGVDNLSDPRKTGPLFQFLYNRFKRENTQFYEMDYLDYFANKHKSPIGVYFYDGDHAYEHQLQGLEVAHPYLASGSYIIVDDTNPADEPAYAATMDFVKKHPEYEVIFDVETANNGHPTFWDGLLILKKK